MHQDADRSCRQTILHLVLVFDSFGDFLQVMLVAPEAERSAALLIHKETRRFYLGNFRHPRNADAGQGANAVGDNQAGIDRIRQPG